MKNRGLENEWLLHSFASGVASPSVSLAFISAYQNALKELIFMKNPSSHLTRAFSEKAENDPIRAFCATESKVPLTPSSVATTLEKQVYI